MNIVIGIPKEIKNLEFRGYSPSIVKELIAHGHKVLVEKNTGIAIGYSDQDYKNAGAEITNTAEEVYKKSKLIIKIKEPQEQECNWINKDQVIFSYLHLAAEPELTQRLINKNCIAIAYETVTDDKGRLPLLAPMSEVAGSISVQFGAHCLEKRQGGMGKLLSGVPGVLPAKVTVIGGGVSGTMAAKIAAGLGAHVTIMDNNINRLRELDNIFGNSVNTIYSSKDAIEHHVIESDLVIGAVLVPGASAPKVIKESLVKKMKNGSVIVDIAIDQGGCSETSKPTSHSNPSYAYDCGNGKHVIHCCVTNFPGAVPITSSQALENATTPYILKLANLGYRNALSYDEHFRNGMNICHGHVTHQALAESLGMDYTNPSMLI